jgi:hypothetical protein
VIRNATKSAEPRTPKNMTMAIDMTAITTGALFAALFFAPAREK